MAHGYRPRHACQSAAAVVALFSGLLAAAPAAAQAPAPAPGLYDTSARALPMGGAQTGTLEDVGERDIFKVEVATALTVLRIDVAHTNATCEVWVRLVDLDGTELGRAAIPRGSKAAVTALVGAAGPIFLVVDDGPFVDCADADYRVAGSLAPIDVSLAGAQRQGSSVDAGNTVLCVCYSSRAEQLSIKVARTRSALTAAGRRRRATLKRKLAKLRRDYRTASRLAQRHCT
jgi:hypothetical protein